METENIHEFEKYPDLADQMREYASFGKFSDWQKFTDVLNESLKKSNMNESIKTAKTLQECKDEVAFKSDVYRNWRHVQESANESVFEILSDQAAELYAQSQTEDLKADKDRILSKYMEMVDKKDAELNYDADGNPIKMIDVSSKDSAKIPDLRPYNEFYGN